MKKSFSLATRIPLVLLLFGLQVVPAQEANPNSSYTLIINGYDWGPGANKVVLPMSLSGSELRSSDFEVEVVRSMEGVEMSPAETNGPRKIVYSYVSDADGNVTSEGEYTTLVLYVAPNDPLSSPIKYFRKDGRGSNHWIKYNLTVKHNPSGKVWDTEGRRIIPPLEKFDLTGTYSQNGINLTYASFQPEDHGGKSPLIIWLHGGGEGGTDPGIALIANKATNYASEEIQSIFKGAFVLVPQSPTFWMQSASGEYTRGDKNDIYNEALMGLIKKYVEDHPMIDANRIYVGGCSNGGYMSLKLILEDPDYFAAAYISALAYQNKYITDAQLESITEVPIWFVHSKDDPVTVPGETVVPLFKRLVAAGAKDVHFSYYDHVVDLSGFYGGKDFRYPGHWSWIYSHVNHPDFDFDGQPVIENGRPVTIMEWMAGKSK